MQAISQFRSSTPKETKRFIKFLVVGAFGFSVDFGSFNLFHTLNVGAGIAVNLFPTWGYINGHPEIIEQTFSFCLAVTSNFLWNYFWIYPEARNEPFFKKFWQFILVSLLGLAIGIPIFSLGLMFGNWFVPLLGLDKMPINVAGNFALVCRVGILLFWNFFVNRKWTYGHIK